MLTADIALFDEENSDYKSGDTTTVWHYMDLWKFIEMIETESVYFRRLDKFEDKWEGSLPKWLVEGLTNAKSFPGNEEATKRTEQYFSEHDYSKSFASCWHISKPENYAMWKVYIKNEPGIAIKTSIGNIIKSLKNRNKTSEYKLFLKRVAYCADGQMPKRGGMFHLSAIKRKPYRYENEMRIIALGDPTPDGFYLPVDLSLLIKELVLFPGAKKNTPHLLSFVEKNLQHYGINKGSLKQRITVGYSGLDEDPPQIAR